MKQNLIAFVLLAAISFNAKASCIEIYKTVPQPLNMKTITENGQGDTNLFTTSTFALGGPIGVAALVAHDGIALANRNSDFHKKIKIEVLGCLLEAQTQTVGSYITNLTALVNENAVAAKIEKRFSANQVLLEVVALDNKNMMCLNEKPDYHIYDLAHLIYTRLSQAQ